MTHTIPRNERTGGNRRRVPLPGRIGEDVRAIFDRDPAALSMPQVLVSAPGLHAILMHRTAGRLWTAGHRFAARIVSHVARAITGVEIHPGARIGRRFVIDHGMGVVIGETTEIGDDVLIYQGVTLGGTSHKRQKRHPTIGDGVVVGAGAKILGAVTVGDGARIGAGAIVVSDVPPHATVVGLAGRVIARRPGRHAPRMGIAESKDDHAVRVLEVLVERVDRLESSVNGSAAPSGRVPADSFTLGAGICPYRGGRRRRGAETMNEKSFPGRNRSATNARRNRMGLSRG